jgi:sec-independent protein translocase protein TatC
VAIRLPLRRRPEIDPQGTMSLAGHLAELRRRLIVSLLSVGAGAGVAFALYASILAFFLHPYCQIVPPGHPCALYVTGPLDGISIRIKIAAWGGLVLALPVVLFQLWRFITPGLHPREKRYSVPFVAASLVFFGLGAAMAWLTFPHALHFLSSVGGPSLESIYSPTSYLSLIVLLMVVFGFAFEFPVVLIALQLAGVVRSATLVRWRRRAIVIVFAVAAVVTPSSDPFSMLAMAVPMSLFYEAAILVGKVFGR